MGDRIGKDFCRDHDLGNIFRDPCGHKVSIKVGGVNLMQEEQQNFVGIAFKVSLILPYMLENLVDYLIPRNLSARSESLLYLTGEDSSLFYKQQSSLLCGYLISVI